MVADLFDRPSGGDRTLLVALDLPGGGGAAAREEFELLVAATDADVLGMLTGSRRKPDPRFFIGSGKAEELAERVAAERAELVVLNHALSPAQERNLEKCLQARVLDRNGLILDIFARRAQTHEGKLQVELAQLRHLSTRLVRGWSHLERQKGGIGLRGPGETQLETDRRLIGDRMRHIERRIEQVRRTRGIGRSRRKRREVPLVSLVGYTNAGKSTLFERLTGSETYIADQLFATLDTTLRQVELPGAEPIILADTVGFVRDLPHSLVAAFRATLEETTSASLLLHVVDATDAERNLHREAVCEVLEEIGADELPRLEVYNKCDLLPDRAPALDRDVHGRPSRVWLSAVGGGGIELLREALVELLHPDFAEIRLTLPPEHGRLRAALFQLGAVRDEQRGEAGESCVTVALSRQRLERLCVNAGLKLSQIQN